jgi:hypothetical protein
MALGCYVFSPVIAGNWTRPNASNLTVIPTIDESYTDTLMGEFTTNSSNVTNTTQILPNLPGIGYLAMSAYTDILGNIAIVMIFAIPFLMMWIMGGSITLPAVVGIIEGGFILYRLPEQFYLVAIGFIVLSVMALIFSLLKDR